MTKHENILAFLRGRVSAAKLTYDNSTTRMGPSRLKALDAAENALRDYEGDEGQHDYATVIVEAPAMKAGDTFAVEGADGVHVVPDAGTDLTMPTGTSLEAAFCSEDDVGGLIELIRKDAEIEAAKHDVTTKKGREAIISVAFGVTKRKTALDKAGKELTASRREEIANINKGRGAFDEGLSALAAELRQPVTDWQTKEAEARKLLQSRLLEINTGDLTQADSVEDIQALIDETTYIELGEDWGDFREDAAIQKDAVLRELAVTLEAAQTREANEARLAELEAAEAERQRIADESAEIERQKQAEIDAENRMRADAAEENARFDLAVKRQAAAVQQAIDYAKAQHIADLEAAGQKRRDDIEAAEQAVRDEEQAKADELEATQKAESDRLSARAHAGRLKAEREQLEREKAHNKRQFRTKARKLIIETLESAGSSELAEAIMDGEFAFLQFVPEGVE